MVILNNGHFFLEQYNAAIHNNDEVDDNAKFTYLKTLLTVKAAYTVQGLAPEKACIRTLLIYCNKSLAIRKN